MTPMHSMAIIKGAISFPLAAVERVRVHARARGEDGVGGGGDAGRQDQRVEIDIAARAGGLVGDRGQFERTDGEGWAVLGPGLRGVIHRVAGFGQGQHHVPAQRRLLEPVVQVFGEKIGAGVLAFVCAHDPQRCLRAHRPADVLLAAVRRQQAEGVDAVVAGIGPTVRPRRGFGPGLEFADFRVVFEQRRLLCGVGFSGAWVWAARQCLRVKALWRGDGEKREIVHRHAPLLTVVAFEQKRH